MPPSKNTMEVMMAIMKEWPLETHPHIWVKTTAFENDYIEDIAQNGVSNRAQELRVLNHAEDFSKVYQAEAEELALNIRLVYERHSAKLRQDTQDKLEAERKEKRRPRIIPNEPYTGSVSITNQRAAPHQVNPRLPDRSPNAIPPGGSLLEVRTFIKQALRMGKSYDQAIAEAYQRFPTSLVDQING